MYTVSASEVERIKSILASGAVRASELDQCEECRQALNMMVKTKQITITDDLFVKLIKTN